MVDEWHELLGNKRGVLLQLALARVRTLAPALRLWGLSATLGNLEEARDVLLPHAPDAALVSGLPPRALTLDTLLPEAGERFPWAGHLGLVQLARVVDRLLSTGTSLLFTNTRSQAELWHRALSAVWPEDQGTLLLHHGSIDAKLRQAAEIGLRDGTVRCVVATSSLDLGVDFPAVDQVFQLGSPKGMARLLQRAGRARHRPGEPAHVVLRAHACAGDARSTPPRGKRLRMGASSRGLPPRLSLDVLAQHCVTLALGGGFDAEALFDEVRGTHAFAELDHATWQAVLEFIVQGGSALSHYPDYRRVVVDADGRYVVEDRKVAYRHRLSIGTITSDGSVAVKFLRGGGLGSVEESFISRLRPGDRFQFAGRTLELVRMHEMTAQVRLAKRNDGMVPKWQGGRLPLSGELGREVERVLAGVASGEIDAPELRALQPLLTLQHTLSALPGPDHLLCEWVKTRDGRHLFVYPFAGRAVHEGLAALIALRWGRRVPNSFSFAANDYGFVLSAQAEVDVEAATLARDAEARRLARRPHRQLQPHRTRAPPVPRDRARRRLVAAVPARPRATFAAATAGFQWPALRRARAPRSRPSAVDAGAARSLRAATRRRAARAHARRLRTPPHRTPSSEVADPALVPLVGGEPTRTLEYGRLARACRARRRATGTPPWLRRWTSSSQANRCGCSPIARSTGPRATACCSPTCTWARPTSSDASASRCRAAARDWISRASQRSRRRPAPTRRGCSATSCTAVSNPRNGARVGKPFAPSIRNCASACSRATTIVRSRARTSTSICSAMRSTTARSRCAMHPMHAHRRTCCAGTCIRR